jgi:hypothetical protein
MNLLLISRAYVLNGIVTVLYVTRVLNESIFKRNLIVSRTIALGVRNKSGFNVL